MRRFRLIAKVSSDDPDGIAAVLERLAGKLGTVERSADGFAIDAEIDGESARDLNRELLSALRAGVKKTRLRAEWTCGGVTERYFDYVLKKTITLR